ncbi:lasso peptide biosynthesis B2 protein [Halobacillus amylolyticus]|uniref:Lasso peptide biosynthesis B2 protein n=1 Tax=Halobacillus amylolyticus TaxID=2932259 RepID=A0ABY4HI31_9BACI|nr:lasso peptide biosynthesis B2 protein [Halobacillus amylolyticus]UOR13968.1 lasso peptide biosynthesis B2 protein [Halobacillus amylolyticus]
MNLMKKLRLFLSLDCKSKRMLFEAYFFLAWARYSKRIPFSKLAPSLGVQMQETTYDKMPSHRKMLSGVSQSIQLMSRYTFWESQCLVKAIAAMKMLEKREIGSTLYLGTARDENGELIAHAWLRSGPYYITGAEGREEFTVVGKFAKQVGGGIHGSKRSS